ncbi:putative nucleoporin NUP49/NSP49 [Aspergillus clavatus NRRL 1]|uniref:Nucleoporin NUP49/NSP49, putative n=1 Tax=Aspergillus clavatus (strain ATCC 1007 / CBS 513.65 / DSM 816 / NCTC 3887 / NRRL 1 / QM 1276 / 107) TaxID=344612 RepID=A1CTW4_ASPCL|nr:nucleoporin NUP49/NSP49, putative [Aspergillus clavatus NRRL 1]EAW06751.1 nucleoporin NUP49/NSP49, putative [Aspergillus clavatus NRRL 1]
MFSAKPSTGLSINTNSANSLFGGANAQTTSSTATPGATSTPGGLFGNAGGLNAQSKPAGGLFGNTGGGNTQQSQTSGSGLFSGLGGQQQSTTTGGGLFGKPAATAQPSSGGLFSGTAGAGNTTAQGAGTGGGLFGSTAQIQSKPLFGGLGASTTTGGGLLGGGNQANTSQQQAQKPTLSLFGNQNATAPQQTTQQTGTTGTVVPGVKVDLSNLLPTTKFESCADEIKSELERFDNYVLLQIKLCNEVSNMLPTIASQGETIPNDVDFVQGKLETMQHALENDARDIDQLRSLVSRDAAEAQVAFRAIDTLKLPLQYQSSGGAGWWSAQDQKGADRQSLRSTRKNTLALPDDVETDPSSATSVNGVPVNLVDYFSQRSDEMGTVLGRYTGNLKEIEDHLHGIELTLNRQIHEFVASRSRDGPAPGTQRSILSDLAVVLGDVETGILGVASRLGAVSEQVQEVVLGPPSGDGRMH